MSRPCLSPLIGPTGHKDNCVSGNKGPVWNGSPNYNGDPDNEWICDECGAVIKSDRSYKGERDMQ